MRISSNHLKAAFIALGSLAITSGCLYPEHGRRDDEQRRVEPERGGHDHDGHEGHDDHENHDFHPG